MARYWLPPFAMFCYSLNHFLIFGFGGSLSRLLPISTARCSAYWLFRACATGLNHLFAHGSNGRPFCEASSSPVIFAPLHGDAK
jgi:hypothetical protein